MAEPVTKGCNPTDVVTNLYQERGRISQTIWERISSGDPFIKALEKTKTPFPSGMGDVLNRRILNVHNPLETDVLNWGRVGAAEPSPDGGQTLGYSPCCVSYKEIKYGDRTVSACMYQDGWKSPEFCIVDLVFKAEWEMAIQDFIETMSNWSKGIWGHWSIMAFQRAVTCSTLNSAYGLIEDHGRYPTPAPTSALTFQHCEEYYRRMKGAGAEMTSAVPGFELVFIGDDEFSALKEKYLQDAGALGNRGTIMLPSLGAVEMLDKYLFVKMKYPRKFRDPQVGETWEDCIVPHSKYVQGPRGTNEVRNPDYYNAAVAKYVEIIFYNMAAAQWLTPPEPLATGLGGFLKPVHYAGEFMLFNQPTVDDPFGKNGRWYADFMAGMIANFPDRARCVMARAVHNRAKDFCPDGCIGSEQPEEEKWHVLDCAELIGGGLQLLVKEKPLPAECPPGTSLFAVDKGGNKWIIDKIVSQEAYAGGPIHTEGGTLVKIEFPASLAAVQNCRRECDGWSHVACMPSDTVVSDPTDPGCQGCAPNTVSADCTFTFEFDSVDGPDKLYDSADAVLVDFVFADPAAPTAAEAETDLQDWITATGTAGTATVVKTGFHWIITVTDAAGDTKTKLTGAKVDYDAGLGYPKLTVVQTGDCS